MNRRAAGDDDILAHVAGRSWARVATAADRQSGPRNAAPVASLSFAAFECGISEPEKVI